MQNDDKREFLLLRLMHLIADNFKNRAVLKGGMCLRLLNSPRSTQDADYVFLGKPSRREILARIKKAISRRPDMRLVGSDLNSSGLIVEFEAEDARAFLEISTAQELSLPPEVMNTSVLALRHHIPAQLITIMSLSEAYAHKIAASLERNSLRDLYDITVLQALTDFDRSVLKSRLDRLSINRKKAVSTSFAKAATMLEAKNRRLKQTHLEEELRGMVPDTFMKGGLTIIKNSLNRLVMELRGEEELDG